jgi:hypothetical protein
MASTAIAMIWPLAVPLPPPGEQKTRIWFSLAVSVTAVIRVAKYWSSRLLPEKIAVSSPGLKWKCWWGFVSDPVQIPHCVLALPSLSLKKSTVDQTTYLPEGSVRPTR